jgi:prolyl-tRNA editing enzyme YbaK/EbsC (Cys-tRNA(Pro) deacylase)
MLQHADLTSHCGAVVITMHSIEPQRYVKTLTCAVTTRSIPAVLSGTERSCRLRFANKDVL